MNQAKPHVWLVGDIAHRDFTESIALVRATANVGAGSPELILLAESRPGSIGRREIERLRRNAPLAGVVSLCGTWCEGELRTGRPIAGATRLYWYEFRDWWRRQMSRQEKGMCPEWAWSGDFGKRTSDCGSGAVGRVAIATEKWESFAAISDLLQSRRCESSWVRAQNLSAILGNVSCGIWEGGQVSDVELERLADFTERMSKTGAPVVALLDFPRADRCELARRVGVAEILGKPWQNADLLSVLERVVVAKHVAARVA